MSRTRVGGALATLVLVLVAAFALAACGAARIVGDSQGPTNPAAATASDPAALSSTQSEGPDDTPGASIAVDPSLLALLPRSVDGVLITEATENEASLATEPSLMPTAAALAVGYAIASGDTASEDLAVTSVIRLKPGVFSTPFWDGWRKAYDAAACEPAGGVASHARQVIGANTAEITVCTEGAKTYHVHLANDILISVTAVGDRHFGDLVLAGLRG